MSKGRFLKTKYKSDRNTFHRIYCQPESTTTTPGNPPADSGTLSPGTAIVSGGRTQRGRLMARKARLGIEYAVNAPGQDLVHTKTVEIPLLQPETYASPGWQPGSTVSYNSESWTVLALIPERWN